MRKTSTETISMMKEPAQTIEAPEPEQPMMNAGKIPFVYHGTMKDPKLKSHARAANRKYYNLKGLPSKLNTRCVICGRHTNCVHKAPPKDYKQPVVISNTITCTSCHETVRAEATYCPRCGTYDPGKKRAKKAALDEPAYPTPEPEPKKQQSKKKQRGNHGDSM